MQNVFAKEVWFYKKAKGILTVFLFLFFDAIIAERTRVRRKCRCHKHQQLGTTLYT
jgi:hypothetical protein